MEWLLRDHVRRLHLRTTSLTAALTGALLLVAMLGLTAGATQDHPLDELGAWVAAVRLHVAGRQDAFTQDIQRWPADKWDRMAVSTRDFVSLLRDQTSTRRRIGSWSEAETLARRQSAVDVSVGVGPNGFLRRAAILHADAALDGMIYTDLPPAMAPRLSDRILPSLLSPLVQAYEAPTPGRPRTQTAADPANRVAGFKDGQVAQFAATRNWEFARRLLDSTIPTPRADRLVLSWYRDVAVELAGRMRLGELKPHLIKAVALFPTDAPLLLDRGCLHETFASPRIQSVVHNERHGRDDSWSLDVAERAPSLVEAASFFRRSLQSDPLLVEARVRLGRVLTLQGRLDEAADLLRSIPAQTDERVILFLGDLFLGNVEDQRGRLREAKATYERARSLYPSAQSALLGLASVTSRLDPAQQAAVDAWPAASTPPQGGVLDPWRVYHLCLGRPRLSE